MHSKAHSCAASCATLLSVDFTLGQLFNGRNNPLFSKLAAYFENPNSWAAAIAEHRRILAALEAHDPEAAAGAMQVHMQLSHNRFTAGWPAAGQGHDLPPLTETPSP